MTKLVPGANDFAILQPLQWNTKYEVEITARNVKGLSEPTFYQFFMPQKPDITGKSTIKVNIMLQFTFLFRAAAKGFLESIESTPELLEWNAVLFRVLKSDAIVDAQKTKIAENEEIAAQMRLLSTKYCFSLSSFFHSFSPGKHVTHKFTLLLLKGPLKAT